MSLHSPDQFRVAEGPYGTTRAVHGNNGMFLIATLRLRIICGDGMGWEHVSVSLEDRCPTWSEMCYVKDLFWDKEDCVMQLHPPASEYVNNHPFCLHLWRPKSQDKPIPQPPSWMVGNKRNNV